MPAKKKVRSSGVPKVGYGGPPKVRSNYTRDFACVVLTAVALYYAEWRILFIAALAFFFSGLFWLCRRFPVVRLTSPRCRFHAIASRSFGSIGAK